MVNIPKIKSGQGYLSLAQTAEYLGMGLSTVQRSWPGWKTYGVNPSRRPGGRGLLFRRAELDAMVRQWRIYKEA